MRAIPSLFAVACVTSGRTLNSEATEVSGDDIEVLEWASSEGSATALVVVSEIESDRLWLLDLPVSEQPVHVTFVSPMLLDGSWTETVAGPAAVFLPPLLAHGGQHESTLSIYLDGVLEEVIPVRVVTIEQFELFGYVPDEAIVEIGHTSALVDLELATEFASDEGVPEVVLLEDGDLIEPPGLCVRVPWGPGKAKWQSSSPGNGGQSFSYSRESDPTMEWATAPDDNIDAIYRTSWGCSKALKVPDSCTATVSTSASISTCCNAAMMALGYSATWINPSTDAYFPDCPL